MAGDLYLVITARDDAAALDAAADDLAAALGGGPVASVLLRAAQLPDPLQRQWIARLSALAQRENAAFLIEDRADLAAELGCDGVHLTANGRAVGYSRRALGVDMIVGALCGRSRHNAMAAGEQGADYVAFLLNDASVAADQPDREGLALLGWWQELMTLPCVAFGARDIEDGLRQVRAGADFLALERMVWDDPAGPAEAVRRITACLQRR